MGTDILSTSFPGSPVRMRGERLLRTLCYLLIGFGESEKLDRYFIYILKSTWVVSRSTIIYWILELIIAGEPWRGSILFFVIPRRRQNLSDVKLKTCAVDCVFLYLGIPLHQRHDKRGEIWLSLITCGSIHEGHEWFTLEEDEIFMCFAVLLCEQFCRCQDVDQVLLHEISTVYSAAVKC